MPSINESSCQKLKFNQINKEQNGAYNEIILRHMYDIFLGWDNFSFMLNGQMNYFY